MPNSSLLAGVTVIDLSRVLAGPFATMTLANLGARLDHARTLGKLMPDTVNLDVDEFDGL